MSDGGGVQRIEITERESPVFDGAEFGAVGAYERLHGTAFCELDPSHPQNAGIVNLDRAPRNARGNVEYQSEFRILKPLDLARGNGWLVYDVPNRGNQPIMARLNGAPEGGHPKTAGNGFLMHRGFTLVWSGWQGDVPAGNDRSDRTASDHRRHHRHGSRGVHRRGNRTARRRQHPGGVRRSLHRRAGLSGRRSGGRDADGARARGRSARDATRPRVAADRRSPRRDHTADRTRIRPRRHLRVHLPRARPDRDGHRLRRDPRHRVVPAPCEATVRCDPGSVTRQASAFRRVAVCCAIWCTTASTRTLPDDRCSMASCPSSPARAAPASTGNSRRPAAIRGSTRTTPTATTSSRSPIRH